jgi:hypothetical protein
MKRQKTKSMARVVGLTLILLASVSVAANDAQGRDAVKIGGDVTIEEGRETKDAVAIGGSVTVLSGGHVAGNAVAIGGDVILKASAQVEGDAVAIGGEILKEAGASVGGNEVAMFSEFSGVMRAMQRWGPLGLLWRLYLASVVLHFLVVAILAVVGLLPILLWPEPMQVVAATIRQHALKSVVWAVGGLLASVLLILLTTGSLLGILLMLVLGLALVVLGFLGCVGTGLFVGERMFPASGRSEVRFFLLGMLILGVVGLVPVVGGLVLLAVSVVGFGAELVSRVGRVQPVTVG